MQIATLIFMVAFAYGLGVFWYDLLPAGLPDAPWRVAAYPFALMVLAEVILPIGPSFMGFHPTIAIVAALIGVVIDWIVTAARHPQAAQTFEMRGGPAHGAPAHS